MAFTTKQNVIESLKPSDEDRVEIESAMKLAQETFEPYYNRILIKRTLSALERKTKKAGILLTDQTKETTLSAEGWVVAVGEDCNAKAKDALGKRILFSKYTGDDIFLTGPNGEREQFVYATDKDIYGVLK